MRGIFSEKANLIFKAILISSVCIACFATFKYSNRIIKYEIDKTAINDDVRESDIERISAITSVDIPHSENYRVILKNNRLHVYDAGDKLVYVNTFKKTDMLSAKDITELEQNGIIVSDRSQLIEFLDYMNS